MKVLVAEDDPAVRRLLENALEQDGHHVVLAEDGEEAWAEYQRSAPEVVIADWMMPRTDGLELCRRIRSHPANGYTYVVVVTGLAAPEHAVEAMRAGADDHLAKPFDLERLEAHLLAASRLTSLHAGVGIDEATGLNNRARLTEDLETLQGRTRRYGHRYWLAVVEIDRLSRYREWNGDDAANDVIRKVAHCLADEIRAGDGLYRLAPDQLLLVLPEQSEASVRRAAERLRRVVERLGLPHVHNPPKKVVTVSLGLAMHEPRTQPDVGRVLFMASQLALASRQTGYDVALVDPGTPRRRGPRRASGGRPKAS